MGVGRYVEDETLMAAPYDWRIPPRKLEERDGYFTSVMTKIETLYAKNGNTPVVLMGHSMGTFSSLSPLAYFASSFFAIFFAFTSLLPLLFTHSPFHPSLPSVKAPGVFRGS